jgi:predicted site-specific integrase-resolvase
MEAKIFTTLSADDLLGIISGCIRDALTLKTQEKPLKEVPEDLLSIEDIQNIFKVSKVTVHKWKKKGLLPFYKMNRKVYFKKSEVINSMSHKKRKMEV